MLSGVIANSEKETKIELSEGYLKERLKKINDIPTHDVLEKIKNNFYLAELLNRSDISWIHDAMLLYMNTITDSEHLLQISRNKKNTQEIFDYVNKSLIALVKISLEQEPLFSSFNNYEVVKRLNHALTELNLSDSFRKQIPIFRSSHEYAEKFHYLRVKLRQISLDLFSKMNKKNKPYSSIVSRTLWQNQSLLKKTKPILPSEKQLQQIRLEPPKIDEELSGKDIPLPEIDLLACPSQKDPAPLVPATNKIEKIVETELGASSLHVKSAFPVKVDLFQPLPIFNKVEEKGELKTELDVPLPSVKPMPELSGIVNQEETERKTPIYSSYPRMFQPSYARACIVLAVGSLLVASGFVSPWMMAIVCGGVIGVDVLSEYSQSKRPKPG